MEANKNRTDREWVCPRRGWKREVCTKEERKKNRNTCSTATQRNAREPAITAPYAAIASVRALEPRSRKVGDGMYLFANGSIIISRTRKTFAKINYRSGNGALKRGECCSARGGLPVEVV